MNTESFLAYINEYWQSVFNLNHIEDTANEPVFLSIEGLRFTGQKSIYDKHDEVVYWIKFFQTISSSLRKEAGVLVEQVSESIHERLRSFKKWANRALLTILAFLGKKRKSKKGIGKDIEGFIPFATWPRPPSNSQLVNSFIFLDKLSHPNNYMEISHGC
ncbi:MAG: hypothetical protein HZB19_02705 [Chloroflexi bacterium]|nr:hypothetical protein [Chloroflexota bacterium]